MSSAIELSMVTVAPDFGDMNGSGRLCSSHTISVCSSPSVGGDSSATFPAVNSWHLLFSICSSKNGEMVNFQHYYFGKMYHINFSCFTWSTNCKYSLMFQIGHSAQKYYLFCTVITTYKQCCAFNNHLFVHDISQHKFYLKTSHYI